MPPGSARPWGPQDRPRWRPPGDAEKPDKELAPPKEPSPETDRNDFWGPPRGGAWGGRRGWGPPPWVGPDIEDSQEDDKKDSGAAPTDKPAATPEAGDTEPANPQ